MGERVTQRILDWIPLVFTTAVGVLTVWTHAAGQRMLIPMWAWISVFAVFAVAMAVVTVGAERCTEAVVATALVVAWLAGCAAVIAAPRATWLPIVLVLTALVSAYLVSVRMSTVVIAVNCAALFAAGSLAATPLSATLLGVGMYALLQVSSVLAIRLFLREVELRGRLQIANVELRAARELLAEAARTTERTRIARDLHDVIGHELTVLALELEAAVHHAHPEARIHVRRAQDAAKALLGDVRATVDALRSEPTRLREALQAVADGVSEPRVDTDIADIILPPDRAEVLVRGLQELLTNTIRHAEAASVTVTVSNADGAVTLTVADDGRGAEHVIEGNGLTGLRERVASVHGVLRIEPTPGFAVHVGVPA